MTDQIIEKIQDAIQDYVRTYRPELVVTDFVVCAVSIDMHTAGKAATYTTITESPPHISYGLAQILTDNILEEDDE